MIISFAAKAQFIDKGLSDSLFLKSDDTTKTWIYYRNENSFRKTYLPLDTNLETFQRYDPVLKGYDFYATNANIGMPHKSLYLKNIDINQFSLGEELQYKYLYRPDNVPYYKLSVPYSEVNYVMGSKEENYLNFTLGNQVSDGLYFGLDMNVESGKGTFMNQRTGNNHFRAVVMSDSRDDRYHLTFNYIRNKMKWNENGGLVNDSAYEDTTRLDRRIVDVNLYNAYNEIKTNYFDLKQAFYFNDSTRNRGGFLLDVNYYSAYRIYADNGDVSHYYQNSFLDSTRTFDSTSYRAFNSFFGWERKVKTYGLSFKAGLQSSYNQYFTGNNLRTYHYLIPKALFTYRGSNYVVDLSGSYQILSSTNASEYNNNRLSIDAGYELNNLKYGLKLQAKFYTGDSRLMDLHYYSNHFIRNNDFNRRSNLLLNAVFDYHGYEISGKYVSMTNYVYYTDSITACQLNGTAGVFSIAFAKEFRFKSFGSNVMALYQTTDKQDVIRLPEFAGRASVFFTFPLFKGALHVHPGFDFTFLSAYYADGYNPAAMVFFVQNEKKIDPQIYTDLFINFKIKRARVFLMYKNINMLFGTYNYFMFLHYPQQDPGFKIGISWRFYD